MNLSVTLEDENRKIIDVLSKELTLEADIDLSNFKLLRYLDPYGDTIFNRYQIDDLITDLERLNEPATGIIISQIISLATRCKDEIHTYLCFNGD